jgi:hypothetical protein
MSFSHKANCELGSPVLVTTEAYQDDVLLLVSRNNKEQYMMLYYYVNDARIVLSKDGEYIYDTFDLKPEHYVYAPTVFLTEEYENDDGEKQETDAQVVPITKNTLHYLILSSSFYEFAHWLYDNKYLTLAESIYYAELWRINANAYSNGA